MKAKILKTVQGSPDGIQVLTYHAGNEYDLNDSLVAAFVQMGVIEVVVDEKPQEPIAAPENAAFVSAPETKPVNKKGKK